MHKQTSDLFFWPDILPLSFFFLSLRSYISVSVSHLNSLVPVLFVCRWCGLIRPRWCRRLGWWRSVWFNLCTTRGPCHSGLLPSPSAFLLSSHNLYSMRKWMGYSLPVPQTHMQLKYTGEWIHYYYYFFNPHFQLMCWCTVLINKCSSFYHTHPSTLKQTLFKFLGWLQEGQLFNAFVADGRTVDVLQVEVVLYPGKKKNWTMELVSCVCVWYNVV